MTQFDDQRLLASGLTIPTAGYADQPYVVTLPDESWLCVLTTASGEEGDPGQHVRALRSRDQGHSWEDLGPLESPQGPEASWAVPLHVPGLGGPLGRVYVFYVYNRDNLREVIAADEYSRRRVDTLGHYVFRYSDDGGLSWSPGRHEIPVRRFAIDRENPYGGDIRFFWSVCKPLTHDGRVYLAVHKVGAFGEGFMARSEGAFLVSDNILQEPDPSRIRWQTLPDGEIGLRATEKSVADEQNLTALSDGSLFCTYRTIEGHPCHAYSRDGGHHWTPPAHMTYGPGQRKVKHPRAANFVRRFRNGKYLFWFHNHGLQWYEGRNPVWLLGGREVETPEGRVIQWSQPEIALYDDDIAARISYPDFIEQDGQIFVTETQKTIARVHTLSPALLDWLWSEPGAMPTPSAGPCARWNGSESMDIPRLPCLSSERGGLSLDFTVRFANLTPHQLLFDSRDERGYGITISLTDRATLRIALTGSIWTHNNGPAGNGCAQSGWESDPGLIRAGVRHHVTVIIDGGPKLILWVIDGEMNDGGASRPFGWGRLHPQLDDLNAEVMAQIGGRLDGEIAHFRVYGRALWVNEAVAHQRTGWRPASTGISGDESK